MALSVEQGQFAVATSGTTTTVNCGFTGKAIILWSDGKTATGESSKQSWSMGIGDGTNVWSMCFGGDDNVATSKNGSNAVSTKLLRFATDGVPTLDVGTIASVAFNSSTFVLTHDATPTAAYLVNYILLGGSDITNVKVGNSTLQTLTGNHGYTGVGFQGDFALLMTASSVGATQSNIRGTIGWGVSSSKRVSLSCSAANAQTTAVNYAPRSIVDNTKILNNYVASTQQFAADLVSLDADGFTLNFTKAAASAFTMGYLVIKGGHWDVGSSAKPTTAAAQNITGIAFKPDFMFFGMGGATAVNTTTTDLGFGLGAGIDNTHACCGDMFAQAIINTVCKSSCDSSHALHEQNSSNLATFTSMNSDGCTLTWSGTGSARLVIWFAARGTTLAGSISAALTAAATEGVGNVMPVSQAAALTGAATLATSMVMGSSTSESVTAAANYANTAVMGSSLSAALTAAAVEAPGLVIAKSISASGTLADVEGVANTVSTSIAPALTAADGNSTTAALTAALNTSVTAADAEVVSNILQAAANGTLVASLTLGTQVSYVAAISGALNSTAAFSNVLVMNTTIVPGLTATVTTTGVIAGGGGNVYNVSFSAALVAAQSLGVAAQMPCSVAAALSATVALGTQLVAVGRTTNNLTAAVAYTTIATMGAATTNTLAATSVLDAGTGIFKSIAASISAAVAASPSNSIPATLSGAVSGQAGLATQAASVGNIANQLTLAATLADRATMVDSISETVALGFGLPLFMAASVASVQPAMQATSSTTALMNAKGSNAAQVVAEGTVTLV